MSTATDVDGKGGRQQSALVAEWHRTQETLKEQLIARKEEIGPLLKELSDENDQIDEKLYILDPENMPKPVKRRYTPATRRVARGAHPTYFATIVAKAGDEGASIEEIIKQYPVQTQKQYLLKVGERLEKLGKVRVSDGKFFPTDETAAEAAEQESVAA